MEAVQAEKKGNVVKWSNKTLKGITDGDRCPEHLEGMQRLKGRGKSTKYQPER